MATSKRHCGDWLTLLESAIAHKPDEIPPGFKTVKEISKETGASIPTVKRKLAILLKQGAVVRADYNILANPKWLRRVAHWKVK